MTKGYEFSNKIIKEEISEEECAKINTLNIAGLSCEYQTKRKYLYDSIKPLIGTVGNIEQETKEFYLEKGMVYDFKAIYNN
jgi:cell division protein FtsI/penicillin-binding protein 2